MKKQWFFPISHDTMSQYIVADNGESNSPQES